jgi:opacity protein-like surface antigen
MLTTGQWLQAVACACLLTSGQAWTQGEPSVDMGLRWSYEIRGGLLRPDLDSFETFYGDDQENYYSLAASYRLRGWLEVGGEVGRMRATGVGVLTSTAQPGGTVRYQLDPVQVFVNAIFQRSQEQRLVPYAGAGIATLVYEQEVEQQPDIDGRTDVGYSARAGLRVRLTSSEPQTTRSHSRSRDYWRGYVLLEAQYTSAKVDGTDLGGDAYLLGFRVEFPNL